MRVVLCAFVVLLALYGAAVVLMSTAWFRALLLRRAASLLEDATGARVEIGRVDFRPALLHVTFYGLVLHGEELPSQRPLFSAPVVAVTLNPISLVRRRLLLWSLECQGATIHIYTNFDGSTNFPRPRATRGGSTAVDSFIDLAVHRMASVGTSVFWNDRRVPLDFSARDVALTLGFKPPSRYAGTFSSLGVKLTVRGWSIPPVTFATKLDLSRDHINLTSLIWRCTGITGEAAVKVRLTPSIQAQIALRGGGGLQELARAIGFRKLTGGQLDWTTDASYQDGNFAASGHFRVLDLAARLSSFEPGRISLSADYSADQRHISLSHLVVQLLGGGAQGGVEVALDARSPKFTVKTQFEDLDLQRVIDSVSGGKAILGQLPIDARVKGHLQATWSGELHDFASPFELEFTPPKRVATGARPLHGVATGTASMANGRPSVNFENLDVHTPHSSLVAHGVVNATASSLDVHFETTDFEEWRSISESFVETPLPVLLKSAAVFTGSVSGSATRPEIQGRFTLGAFSYRDWKWDHFESAIDATPDHVAVTSAKLLAGTSALTFDVSADLERWKLARNASVRLSAQAEKTPLEGLDNALAVSVPLQGQLTGRVSVAGTRQNLTGGAAIRIEPGTLENEPFDWLDVQARVTGSVWNFESIQLAKGDGRLEGQARVEMSRRQFSARLRGTNFSLADSPAVQALEPQSSRPGSGLEGHIEFEITGDGTLDRPRIQSTLQARDLNLNGSALGYASAKLDWTQGQLQLDASLEGGRGAVHVSGEARTRGNWPADLNVNYTNLSVTPWIRSLKLRRFGAEVTVTGSTHLSGPLKNPRALQMRSHNPGIRLSLPGLVWTNDRPVDLTLSADVLTVDRFELTGPATRFEVQGSVRLSQPAALALSAQGQIDAALLAALDPSILTAGEFEVELRTGGTVADPLLYGTVKVDDVSLGYPGFPLRVASLTGQVRLEGDRLTIASLRGITGQSSTTFTGFISLSGTPHYDLRATLDRARAEYPLDFTSLLSGNVHLAGSAQGGTLNGFLTVQQMFVGPNFNLVDWMAAMANSPATGGSETPASLASRIRLDVHLATEPAVTVESHDLSMTAEIDTTLRGTAADPIAFGSVHILNGRIVVRNNSTYTITRGDITMANPVRTQPVLDIEAETRVRQYRVTLTVTGPADHARIAYRSDPPLPPPDVLALLALGYARQEEEISGGTGRSGFGSLGASALLSQALSSEVSGRIQRLFGFSHISVDPNPGGSGGMRVTVEQHLARNFTVTYVNTTGGLQQRIVQLEWDLSDNVSLLGVRDQNGVFGVEIDFRHRFK